LAIDASDRSGTPRNPAANAVTVAIAWAGGLLILSNLPDIIFRTATGSRTTPEWLPGLALLLLVLMLAIVALWPPLQPLRGYALTLVALGAGYLIESIVEHSAFWISWNQRVSPGISFVLVNSAKVIPVATLLLSLVGSGLSRKDVFIALGDFRARVMRIGARTVSWAWLLPVALLVSVGPVIANVAGARHPDFRSTEQLLPLVPLILAGAAINTFSEEFLFRQVLLARLIPVLGVTQAVWLTALRFGVGHWFGNPSGPTGVVLATVFGLVAARSMLDTRGSGWIWLVHLVNDIVIFSLIALTTARWI
jgi:membrane protease YdiL (CAAX protease family)